MEDGEHKLLLSLEVLKEGSERRGRGRATKDQAVQWATVCCVLFLAFNAVLFLCPFLLAKFGQR